MQRCRTDLFVANKRRYYIEWPADAVRHRGGPFAEDFANRGCCFQDRLWAGATCFQGWGTKAIVVISMVAALGVLLRWKFGVKFTHVFPTIPPGTLVADLIGAYVIGMAMVFFASFSALSPEWRLFVVTGFCGGLTSFPTFSAELTILLQE